MNPKDFKGMLSFRRPLHRDRLDHLLAFIEARPALRASSNMLLEAFYQTKEYAKRRVNWRSPLPRRDEPTPDDERRVTVLDLDTGYGYLADEVDARPQDLVTMKQLASQFHYKPLISVLMPTYNAPADFLRDAIESVRRQAYPHWELCIADDCSTDPEVLQLLADYADRDSRIKVAFRKTNGHISICSNTALELVTGDYVALLDHDDMLTPDALFHVALVLNQKPDTDMLYSDEDKLSENNQRYAPFFKPDWSPESFLSRMYTCHLGVYRTSLMRSIGGFRKGFEGSQDYDLVLRITERTKNIVHIPRVLYHWRVHTASTAGSNAAKPYAFVAAKKALNDALDRRNTPGKAVDLPGFPGHYRVRYKIQGRPRVAIVIPTRDFSGVLGRCLTSLFAKTKYSNFEVVVVDNGSVQSSTAALFDKWQRAKPDQFKVVRDDSKFNFSALCNLGAAQTDAKYLLFLNNDTEIISGDWLEGLLEYAQQTEIGAVGAKLLYANRTVQHVGVVVGLGGAAGHIHLQLPRNVGGYYGWAVCSNNVSAVTGACLMVERQKFDAVGGFDPTLAVGYNDVDLCLKLLNAGYRNVVLPSIEVLHHESLSRGSDLTPEKWSRLNREGALLQERWSGTFWRDPYFNPNFSHKHPHCVIALPGERRSTRHDAWSSSLYELSDVALHRFVTSPENQKKLAAGQKPEKQEAPVRLRTVPK